MFKWVVLAILIYGFEVGVYDAWEGHNMSIHQALVRYLTKPDSSINF